jgi:integrase/recombinase XerD
VTLHTAVEDYIARKRLMGRRYVNAAIELRSFANMYPGHLINALKPVDVSLFLNRRPTHRSTWAHKHGLLKAFFSYWLAKQEIARLPMPNARPAGARVFSPYIFSRSEVMTLLRHCPTIQGHRLSQVTPETFQLLVILLYSTGMFVNEALSLRVSDLDFTNAVVTLSARTGSARTIPIIRELNTLLRRRVRMMTPDEFVFQTKRGSIISIQRIDIHFRRVRAISSVARNDLNKYQPLLRDLRHTFAVNRICDWYRRKQSVELMLPRMASYLGLRTFPIVEKYLPLAPAHFRRQVRELAFSRRR